MTKILILLLVFVDSTIAFAGETSNFEQVRITRVYDGDTVFADLGQIPMVFANIGIRLRGIDSPEVRALRECERQDAENARFALHSLITDQLVDLIECKPDKYFRLNYELSLQGQDMSEWMIENGFAVPYSGDEKKPAWVCRS